MPFSLQTGGSGGSGGLAAVAHDATLRGSGTAADPIGLAAAETAKIDEVHDVHRAVLARWTVTAADLRIGASIASYGFTRIIYASADGEPTQTAGGIDPAPATLSEGGDSWRLVAVRQDAASHEIEIVLGAPLGHRTVHARGRASTSRRPTSSSRSPAPTGSRRRATLPTRSRRRPGAGSSRGSRSRRTSSGR